MSKVTKIFFVGFLTFSLLISSGCGSSVEPTKDPNETIKDAVNGMQDADSYSYDFSIDADIMGPEGSSPSNITFAGDMSGLVNVVDAANPSFSMSLDGSFGLDDEPAQKLAAELRYVGQNLYARLAELPLPEGEQLPEEITNTLLNVWWSYPLPEEVIKELGVDTGGELTEEQKQIKELFEKSDFIVAEYMGNADVNGVNSFKYKVSFDDKKFVDFVEAVGKEKKEVLSAAERTDLESALEAVSFEGFVYASTDDAPYVTKIDGTVTIDAKSSVDVDATESVQDDRVSGTIEFSWTNADVNKGLQVEVPENAQPFSPLLLAGLGLLGPQPLTEPSTLEVE